MKKSVFFIKEGPKEVDFDMEKVFLRNESVDVVSTASDNLKFFLDEKLLKLDNILKERHGELINCLKDVELRVERVEKEMIDNGLKLVQRDFITSDSKDFEKKSPEIDDSFSNSKKEDNLPNISIGQEELDALLEGINYAPKESEVVQHDVKFNKDKDFDLTSNLHTADNFSNISNNLIKKEGIYVGSDNVSLENMELNNNNDHNEKLESFVDNKQHLDLMYDNGNIEHEDSANCTVFKSSGEPLELKEFDDFESILKKDLDSQMIEGSFSNDGEKNLRDSLRDVAGQDQSNNIANCEKLSSQNITEDHSSSHFNFHDVEKVVSKFNAEESLSNVVLNSDEKTVLINFIDRVESELELNPNRNIFKVKQEYEVLKKVKFLLTKG
ncbi:MULTISPECIES: hypothetical protein [Borreliella]|uniref:Uncharacterized protein n=1 Tax=Borrelia garinii subsp. bavariensis (strain ATCC BAA-2496 / DSM 23469 / PBi) TaxID=290434 RepID=A0A7I6GWX7_BORGP|nr:MULTISPECIES: hypothetical protein [Borreliella]AAU07596.1 hypothetical protein BG0772 [Borreliella bavariensis PBi]AZA26420.1 hypothetical protein DB299_00480 [Borreliella bavariensis PBi]WLN24382.1 hypothetical protein IDK87_03815 [Borreliella bavariensis]